MKFTPRSLPPATRPLPPPGTRSLRLVSGEEVAAAQGNRAPRPLPEFPSPRMTNTTQRLRLRLDPEVATRPLPAPPTVDEPTPAGEEMTAGPAEQVPAPFDEIRPPEATTDLSDPTPAADAADSSPPPGVSETDQTVMLETAPFEENPPAESGT